MISRRRIIKSLVGVGAVGTLAGAVRWGLLAPPPHQTIGDARSLLRSVFEQLPDGARASALVPYDHPLRQYHNRGLWIAGATVAPSALSWGARRDLADLVVASLSPAGRQRILDQDAISVSGVNFAKLLFCGDPRSGLCQAEASASSCCSIRLPIRWKRTRAGCAPVIWTVEYVQRRKYRQQQTASS